MLDLFAKATPVLIEGFWITLKIGLFSILFASFIGLLAALMRTSSNKLVANIAFIYSTVFRGTPLLIQLFLLYYGIGSIEFIREQAALWWLFSDGARCAILAISLNSGAYMSEAIRGGLQSVPGGQKDAALAFGFNSRQMFSRIVFPIAIKGTSLASTIAVMELTGFARRLMSQSYLIIETFIIAGLLYLAINITLLACAYLVERALK